MFKDLISPLVSLFSIFAAVVGIYLAHLFSLQRADKDMRLKKAEELMKLTESFFYYTSAYIIAHYSPDEPISWFAVGKDKQVDERKADEDYDSADILVHIYFPAVLSLFMEIGAVSTNSHMLARRMDKGDWSDKKLTTEDLRLELMKQSDILSTAQKEFRAGMMKEVARLRSDSLLLWVREIVTQ